MCMIIDIERYHPDIEKGLSSEQVEERKKAHLVNKSKKAFGKTYTQIIVSNLFSFFNIVLYLIAGILIYVAVRFSL